MKLSAAPLSATPVPLLLFVLLAGLACAAPGQLLAELSAPTSDPGSEARSEPTDPPGRPPRPLGDDGTFYVLGADPAHPRVRYLDGQLALNESCAVRIGNKLSRKVPPVYVNGQPVGFC